MNYEIVELKQKIIVGISVITSNDDPKMNAIIGVLWGKFYQEGILQQINNRVNDYAIGLYSDYSDNEYVVTVGTEVSEVANDGLVVKNIPASKYAKFSASGKVGEAVAKTWAAIWQTDLNRSFTGDFEEYVQYDGQNEVVDIYIALK